RSPFKTIVAAATAVLLIMVFTALGAGADVNGSPSGFESNDGNMVLNHNSGLTNTNTDWNCFVGSTGFVAGTPDAKCKVTSGATQTTADINNTTEIEWKSGQKFDTLCPILQGGNNPPKDEFTNVASYSETASNLDLFFY